MNLSNFKQYDLKRSSHSDLSEKSITFYKCKDYHNNYTRVKMVMSKGLSDAVRAKGLKFMSVQCDAQHRIIALVFRDHITSGCTELSKKCTNKFEVQSPTLVQMLVDMYKQPLSAIHLPLLFTIDESDVGETKAVYTFK